MNALKWLRNYRESWALAEARQKLAEKAAQEQKYEELKKNMIEAKTAFTEAGFVWVNWCSFTPDRTSGTATIIRDGKVYKLTIGHRGGYVIENIK